MQDNPSAAVRNAFFALTADVLAAAPIASRVRTDLVKTCDQSLGQGAVSGTRCRGPSMSPMCWQRALRRIRTARVAFVTSIGTGVGGFACGSPAMSVSFSKPSRWNVEPWLSFRLYQRIDWLRRSMMGRANRATVGLYSLLEASAFDSQARPALNAGTRIEHNADTTATGALRSLALSADFLIVDTKHAAHAATLAIDAVRPRDRQLFPAGRGMSSFISALRDALERDRAAAGVPT